MAVAAEINSYYNIQTHAPSIIADMNNAKLTGIVGYDAAATRAVALRHTAVYPYLPTGTQKSAQQLTYYIFLTSTGETIYLAKEWIRTIALVVSSNYRLDIRNITAEQLQTLKDQLLYMNLADVTITTIA